MFTYKIVEKAQSEEFINSSKFMDTKIMDSLREICKELRIQYPYADLDVLLGEACVAFNERFEGYNLETTYPRYIDTISF